MRQTQLFAFTLIVIFTIITALPLENARVKRQWGMPYGGMGMGHGMYGGGFPGYGGGYGGGYGHGYGWRRPIMHRTVVVHHYHPWRS